MLTASGPGCYAGLSEEDAPEADAGSGGPMDPGGAGESGEGDAPPGTDPPPDHDAAVDVECDDPLAPTPWLKLSTVQYRNTVRDLLVSIGAEEVAEEGAPRLATVPEDSRGEGFGRLDARISQEHVAGYFNVAKAVADAVTSDPGRLEGAFGPCALEDSLSTACKQGFVDTFATRAYRRPLSEAEIEALLELDDGTRTPAEALRAMIIVVMNSPHFVTQVEIAGRPAADSEAVLDLSPYELASRLSYTFWQTMPDDELLAAAADGRLGTAEGFLSELDRVFADPRTRETLWEFWREWLKLDGFTGFETSRPGFQSLVGDESFDGDALHAAMVEEVRLLTERVMFDQEETMAWLLATPESVTASRALAEAYGVEPWNGEGEPPTLDPSQRAGLLQRGALLVNALEQTNPFHRGAFVRRHLLCDPLPQPDPNALPPGSLDPPPVDEARTTRERFMAKVEDNPLCEGCHGIFSDIGYVLESYDALGRYRTHEQVFDEQTGALLAELPLDLEVVPRIVGTDDETIRDAATLNEKIIESGKVEECLAQNFYAYVARRTLQSGTSDRCVRDTLAEQLGPEGEGLAAVFKNVARIPAFLQRKVGEP